MASWDQFLPKNGSKVEVPSMPDTTMILDSLIEMNGLAANSLFGSFSALLEVGSSGGGGYLRIDSANKRIIMNDGSHDRLLIGWEE